MKSSYLHEELETLNSKITDTFNELVEKLDTVLYYDIEDCDNTEAEYGDVSDCPTSYYNDNNGNECYIHILKIDSDGIHIVEFDNYSINLCINFSEINGSYTKIEIIKLLENQIK